MKKVKIGIVGMGRMGITHYSIINSHPNVEVVSISDKSKSILDVFSKYLPNLKVYTDYKLQLEEMDLDGIIVCTPPNLHYEICKYACEKGIHVFCEKPFTTSPVLAKELSDMFISAGLVNQVGYVNRFNDVFVGVKYVVNQGVIGNVVHFKSEIFSRTVSAPESGDGWRSKRESGGGVVYEMAVHALDLINYIIGVPTKVIGSTMSHVYSRNVEDIVSTTFLYDTECRGSLYANWCDTSYRKPSNKLELFGSKGKILADQHGMKIFLNESNENLKFRSGWNTVYITDLFKPVPFYVRGNEFTRQLCHFVDNILSDSLVNICDFKSGYETQYLVYSIFKDFENTK